MGNDEKERTLEGYMTEHRLSASLYASTIRRMIFENDFYQNVELDLEKSYIKHLIENLISYLHLMLWFPTKENRYIINELEHLKHELEKKIQY